MPTPQVDIDQLRRQYPEEIVRYFDEVVAAKFAAIDWQIDDLEQQLAWIQETIDAAVAQAEQDFINTALADLAAALEPYVSAQIAAQIGTQVETELRKWVFNSKAGSTARYKFYIDSIENIEALAEREKKMLYIGTEEEPDESSDEPELTRPDDNVLSTDV